MSFWCFSAYFTLWPILIHSIEIICMVYSHCADKIVHFITRTRMLPYTQIVWQLYTRNIQVISMHKHFDYTIYSGMAEYTNFTICYFLFAYCVQRIYANCATSFSCFFSAHPISDLLCIHNLFFAISIFWSSFIQCFLCNLQWLHISISFMFNSTNTVM